MKIGIITHYDVHNHGAQLQLYALEKVLNKMGNSARALTFNKNYDFMEDYAEKKYNISIKSIPYYLGYLKKFGIKRTWFNIKKKMILKKFRNENHMIGESSTQVLNLDAVIIGSDEVFSIEAGLTPEFFGGNIACKNIFSYAACFGPTNFDLICKRNAENFIRNGINGLKKVSVRDKNSQTIIKKICGIDSEIVCDPVILYGYGEEKKNFKRLIPEKYLFVYAYDNNMNEQLEYIDIKKYAREHGLKIITAGFYHAWCDKSINVDPIELLNWIAFADCVVTDTFHGTVMSLVMNVPFATKIRGNRNKLGFLLHEYGTEDREIKEFSDLSIVLERSIDYKRINKVIEARQKQGRAYINKCISKIW